MAPTGRTGIGGFPCEGRFVPRPGVVLRVEPAEAGSCRRRAERSPRIVAKSPPHFVTNLRRRQVGLDDERLVPPHVDHDDHRAVHDAQAVVVAILSRAARGLGKLADPFIPDSKWISGAIFGQELKGSGRRDVPAL